MSKGGANLQIILGDTFEQRRSEAPIKIQPKILCSRCYEQGRGEAANNWEDTFEQGRGKLANNWEVIFEQRRGEVPIGIQPRATLWVKMHKLTSAL